MNVCFVTSFMFLVKLMSYNKFAYLPHVSNRDFAGGNTIEYGLV